ncbi:NO-inducible flavohemoprotein [Brevibacillus daliensis]|uniref:NO-inducible flavohemoprotein n=1 Tax=Brevibacillus daliensis TaxID=2892995 RepID=UPI001E5D34C4|nr:NO-inducible flavohemoprotein [Brevibacillus daliensis]
MLSDKTISIVKATVPVLETHGVTITETFYRTMFERNPEVKNFFNQSNQKAGGQPIALAQAVLAAAKNIDQLHVLEPAIMHIVHKHRSLHVTPELYPIVGENLLLAIKEVLGDQATDEIINAWAEAYGAIADVFISLENKQVKETLQQNGWEGYLPLIVTGIVQESSNIKSFYLKRPDDKTLPVHQAGQYISVQVDVPGVSYKQPRQYSLSMAPNSEYYRISVKKEEQGIVSGLLHNNWKMGDTLEAASPSGNFVYEGKENTPVVFIAGGVGITPLLSMLHVAKADTRPIHFVHCVQNSDVHPFAEEVKSLARSHMNLKVTTIYSNPIPVDQPDVVGLLSKEWIGKHVSKEADVYVCGPTSFMNHVVQCCQANGLAEEQIRFEVFGPSIGLGNN